MNNLRRDINALREIENEEVILTSLIYEINRAEALVQTNYTIESWAQMQRSLTTARNVRDNPNATQGQGVICLRKLFYYCPLKERRLVDLSCF